MTVDPLGWITAKYAEITALPDRLQAIMDRAHGILSDSSRPMAERQAAGTIWASAMADRAEVVRALSHIQEADADDSAPVDLAAPVYSYLAPLPLVTPTGPTTLPTVGMQGLGAGPLLLVVVGVSAVALYATLTSIFGRASTYEQELAAIQVGTLSVEELERIRDTGPTPGAAGTLHEAQGLLKWGMVGAVLWWLAKRYR